MGARGNSGVILSQIWRGMAQSFWGKRASTASDLAEAFQIASQMAYEGLENPVEGTILTVMKEIAAATAKYLDCGDDSVKMCSIQPLRPRKKRRQHTQPSTGIKEAGVVIPADRVSIYFV